jgi:hypothetical protein
MVNSSISVDQFAENLLQKFGLFDILRTVVEDIEEEIAGSYDAHDDDDEDATPFYDSVIYTIYDYLNGGDFDYRIEEKLTETQKNFLKKIIKGDNFFINVERIGYDQKWEMFLYPEVSPNSNERLEIAINLEIPIFAPSKYRLSAFNNTASLGENYQEILFLLVISS